MSRFSDYGKSILNMIAMDLESQISGKWTSLWQQFPEEKKSEVRDKVAFLRDFDVSRDLMILGTGWCQDDVLESQGFVAKYTIPFSEFLDSSGSGTGHKNLILVGELWGKEVVISQGRMHLNQVLDNPDLLRRWMSMLLALMGKGQRIIITSSVGGLGDTQEDVLVLDQDMISADITQPYLNADEAEYVTAFEVMAGDLAEDSFLQAANVAGFETKVKGVRRFISGPGFGGPAERRLWHSWGATTVSMSGDPELRLTSVWNAQVQEEEKKRIMLIGFVTDAKDRADHNEIQERALRRASDFGEFLLNLLNANW